MMTTTTIRARRKLSGESVPPFAPRRDAINTVRDDVVGRVNTENPTLPRAIAVAIVRGRVGGCQLARHDVEREMGNKKSTSGVIQGLPDERVYIRVASSCPVLRPLHACPRFPWVASAIRLGNLSSRLGKRDGTKSGLENFRMLPTRMISVEFIERFLKFLRKNGI